MVPPPYAYVDWPIPESGSELTIKPVENGFLVSTVTYPEPSGEDYDYLPDELRRSSARRARPKTRQFVFPTAAELLAWLDRHLAEEA